jgi:hypothetical protein
MEVEYIDKPEQGYLIYNFAVGKDDLKPNVLDHPNWNHMIQAVSEKGTEWSAIGLADCHGDDGLNSSLRLFRAGMVFGALPDEAAANVHTVKAAPLHQCITDNTTSDDRTFNRAVLLVRDKKTINVKPEKPIEGKRPVPKPQPQPTVDCNDDQQRELDAALPIARAMTQKAMEVLGQRRTPEIRELLSKYFNDPSGNWRIYSGFKAILHGLKDNVTLECENKGSTAYNFFCPQSSTEVRVAYVRTLAAFRVHLCEAAFGRNDLELAETLVHEFSHMYDHTNIIQDETYCWKGGCGSLDRWDAYDNADSFAAFAAEAYKRNL